MPKQKDRHQQMMRTKCVRLCCGAVIGVAVVVSSFGIHIAKKSQHNTKRRILLSLQQKNTADDQASSNPGAPLGRKQGVYVRPSGAIERGSGFYFPGLEGGKVRWVFGGVLLFVIAINHFLSATQTTPALEIISTVYAVLVLLQGIVQWRREQRDLKAPNAEIGTTIVSYVQTWSVDIPNEEWKQTVEWAAATFTALTPATHVVLVSKESNIFVFGRTAVPNQIGESTMSTIAQSSTGRLSLPLTHPVSLQLDEQFRKTVLLQSVTEDLCLVIASDQLFAAFSTSDLEWLGRLAKLLAMEAE